MAGQRGSRRRKQRSSIFKCKQGEERTTGCGVRVQTLRAHPSPPASMSSSKPLSPKTPQTRPPTGDQVSKCLSLWSYSNHYNRCCRNSSPNCKDGILGIPPLQFCDVATGNHLPSHCRLKSLGTNIFSRAT